MGAPAAPEAPVDLNVLRDWSEWRLVAPFVEEADPGAVVLVDGDLQPDWRIPARWLTELLARAAERRVDPGRRDQAQLARPGRGASGGPAGTGGGGALGPRACWWAPVAVRRPEVGPGLLVVVARLDPDARFAFRIDLPADADAPLLLGQLCAFPTTPVSRATRTPCPSPTAWPRAPAGRAKRYGPSWRAPSTRRRAPGE